MGRTWLAGRGRSLKALGSRDSTAHDNGDVVVIYSDEWQVVRGMTWNVFAVRRRFSPSTDGVLGDILFRELDEPNDRGHVDVPERVDGSTIRRPSGG